MSGVGNESSQNDNDSGHSDFGDQASNSATGLANPDMVSGSNNNAAHKVKFSTKGLNAQQLQLIEKLLKEKKCTGSKSNPVSATTPPPVVTTGASMSAIAESNAAAALAAVQSPPKGPVTNKPPQQVWS